MADRLTFEKDPDAILDYVVDWSSWLDGDTISSSDWIVPAEPAGPPAVDSDAFSATTTTVWLSGGTDGETYEFVNRVDTAGGRRDDRTVKFKMKHK
jgi:hypothetical protein